MVITCNEVTAAQLPHVLEYAQCIIGVESVVFNIRMHDLHSDSLQSVHSDYHSNAASPALLGVSGPAILKKYWVYHASQALKGEKGTVQFKQWYHAISDAQKNFNEQLVRAAITK